MPWLKVRSWGPPARAPASLHSSTPGVPALPSCSHTLVARGVCHAPLFDSSLHQCLGYTTGAGCVCTTFTMHKPHVSCCQVPVVSNLSVTKRAMSCTCFMTSGLFRGANRLALAQPDAVEGPPSARLVLRLPYNYGACCLHAQVACPSLVPRAKGARGGGRLRTLRFVGAALQTRPCCSDCATVSLSAECLLEHRHCHTHVTPQLPKWLGSLCSPLCRLLVDRP